MKNLLTRFVVVGAPNSSPSSSAASRSRLPSDAALDAALGFALGCALGRGFSWSPRGLETFTRSKPFARSTTFRGLTVNGGVGGGGGGARPNPDPALTRCFADGGLTGAASCIATEDTTSRDDGFMANPHIGRRWVSSSRQSGEAPARSFPLSSTPSNMLRRQCVTEKFRFRAHRSTACATMALASVDAPRDATTCRAARPTLRIWVTALALTYDAIAGVEQNLPASMLASTVGRCRTVHVECA